MPLAAQRRGIACRLQRIGNRFLLSRQAEMFRAGRDGVFESADALLVSPRHKAAACGRADGSVRVKIGEPHALLREPVNVRRLDVRRAIATHVTVAQVISEDEQNVRPSLRSGAKAKQTYRQQGAEESRG